MTGKTVGVGIIGAGGRGIRCIARNMAESCNNTGFRVVALCDINPDNLAASSELIRNYFEKNGVSTDPMTYDRPEPLINNPRVDLIVITSHSCDHKEAAVPALKSGKKVYCDKPLAHTAEDAVAIRLAERETNNPMLLGFTRRYERVWREARRLVDEGTIGDVKMVEARLLIPYQHYFQTWHRRRKWSGGGLMDKCSHHMDVFNWFTGAPAEEVHGYGGVAVFKPDPHAPLRCSQCDRDCPWRAVETKESKSQDEILAVSESAYTGDTAERFRWDTCVYRPGADDVDHTSIHFHHANGCLSTLQYAIFCPPRTDARSGDHETFEIVGDSGRMRIVRNEGRIELIGDHGARRENLDFSDDPEFMQGHFGADLELIREMYRFVEGTPPLINGHEGCESTRMIIAAQKSIDCGKPVALSEITGAE